MHCVVLFTLFSGLTQALVVHENVFHEDSDIVLTKSKELSEFIIDLKHYFPAKEDFRNIIKRLKIETIPLKHDQVT